jgi:hypothetical protein
MAGSAKNIAAAKKPKNLESSLLCMGRPDVGHILANLFDWNIILPNERPRPCRVYRRVMLVVVGLSRPSFLVEKSIPLLKQTAKITPDRQENTNSHGDAQMRPRGAVM